MVCDSRGPLPLCQVMSGVSEHLADTLDGRGEDIYLLLRVVQGERCPRRALYLQTLHEGLGAVVACADSDTETVEECAHVEMVDVAYEEADDSIMSGSCSSNGSCGG